MAPVVAALPRQPRPRLPRGRHRAAPGDVPAGRGPVRLPGRRRPRRDAATPDARGADRAPDGEDRRLARDRAIPTWPSSRATRPPCWSRPWPASTGGSRSGTSRRACAPATSGRRSRRRSTAGWRPRSSRSTSRRRESAKAALLREGIPERDHRGDREHGRRRAAHGAGAAGGAGHSRRDRQGALRPPGPGLGASPLRPDHRAPPGELRGGHPADLRGDEHAGAPLPGLPVRVPRAPEPERRAQRQAPARVGSRPFA